MNRIIILLCCLMVFQAAAQEIKEEAPVSELEEQMYSLSKNLRKYQNKEENKGFSKAIGEINAPELEFAKQYAEAAVLNKRFLLEKRFLEINNKKNLDHLATILELSGYILQLEKEDAINTLRQLMHRPQSKIKQQRTYYGHLFAMVIHPVADYGIKNQRFFFDDISLLTEQERGMFYLVAMSKYHELVYRPLKVENPPLISVAKNWLFYFPTFENKPYYYFKNFDFDDFKIREGSFKSFYIEQYYELLLSHLFVLRETDAKQEKIDDLLTNSILLQPQFYRYTSPVLKEILIELNKNTVSENQSVSSKSSNKNITKQGIEMLEAGNPVEAIAAFKQAIQQEPDNFKLFDLLGNAYLANNEHDAAIEVFEKSISVDKASPLGYYGLSRTLFKQKKYTEALSPAKKALARFAELNPDLLFQAQGLIGMIYTKLGDAKSAKPFLKKAEKGGFILPKG